METNAIHRYRELNKTLEPLVPKHLTGNSRLFHLDVLIACEMLKEGISYTAVQQCIRAAFFSRENSNSDAKAANIYTDKVFEQAERLSWRDSKSGMKSALKALRLLVQRDTFRYQESGDTKNYGIHRKFSILLALLLEYQFPLELIKAALSADQGHTLAFRSEEEKKTLLDYVQKLAASYEAIHRTEIMSQTDSARGVYLRYAKEYLDETNTRMLTKADDEQIVARMYRELGSLYARQFPQTTEGQRELRENLDFSLKPFIRQALEEGSPAAREPGRNKDDYVNGVLFGAEHIAVLNESPEQNEQRAKNSFAKAIENFKKRERERNSYDIRVLADAEAAKNMIEDRYDEATILRLLRENHPENPYQRLSKPQNQSYEEWLLAGARESLRREKEILYGRQPEIPETALNYYQVQEAGFTADDLYLAALQERLKEYPGTRLHLAESQTDIDIVGKLLTKYTDMDYEALKESIRSLSARQALPGMPRDYAEYVMREAQREKELVYQREQKHNELQKEFNRSCGFAAEGVMDDKPMNEYKDGRVALKMLERNTPEDDILRMLVAIAPEDRAVHPSIYGRNILAKAKEVLSRNEKIRTFLGGENEIFSAADTFYLTEAQKQIGIRPKGFADTNMDIAIYEKMLRQEMPDDEIKKAIRTYSPNIAEPGREQENYVAFVAKAAQERKDGEEQKLKNYLALPRQNHAESVAEEYEYPKNKIMDFIRLPFNDRMEEKIVACLLKEQFASQEIAEHLEKIWEQEPTTEKGRAMADVKSFIGQVQYRIDHPEIKRKQVEEESKIHNISPTQTMEKVRTRMTCEVTEE